jgi:fermentation-respiration switch protein FrsA (DUF1100 family)
VGRSPEHVLGRNRFESARKIANVTAPLLIAHGTKDEIVPVEQGRRLFESAREPKRLKIVEGGGHNLAGNGGVIYLHSIAAFIRDVMRSSPQSPVSPAPDARAYSR